MTELDDWLTDREAAELAGYHRDHIRRLIRLGEIKARKWGASWMINRESLLAYLKRVEAMGKRRGPKK